MAGAVGFEPTPRVLETRLYGFEDRCATITLSPYLYLILLYLLWRCLRDLNP